MLIWNMLTSVIQLPHLTYPKLQPHCATSKNSSNGLIFLYNFFHLKEKAKGTRWKGCTLIFFTFENKDNPSIHVYNANHIRILHVHCRHQYNAQYSNKNSGSLPYSNSKQRRFENYVKVHVRNRYKISIYERMYRIGTSYNCDNEDLFRVIVKSTVHSWLAVLYYVYGSVHWW